MDPRFEQVYTIEHWYDGPRADVADFAERLIYTTRVSSGD